MKAHNIILNNEHYPLLEAENNTGNSGLKLSTGDGFIMLGPLNTNHAHIETDLTNFYFNREIKVDTGVIGSYNEDLYLRRASNSGHQIQITTTAVTTPLNFDAAGYVEANNYKVNTTEVIDGNRVLKNITRADFTNFSVTGTSTTSPSYLRYANIAANVEGSHMSHPYFFNDLANFTARGGTVTIGGLNTTPAMTQPFKANPDFASWAASNYSGSTMTITLTSLPKPLSYGGYIGIAFGNTGWGPASCKIEISTDGGSTWTTRLNDSSNKEIYFTTTGTGATAANAIRFTLGQPTSSLRLTNIWAYNYNSNGMEDYFLSKGGGTVYGNITSSGAISGTALQISSGTVINTAKQAFVTSVQHSGVISFLDGTNGTSGSGAQGINVRHVYAGTSYSSATAGVGEIEASVGFKVAGNSFIDSSRNITSPKLNVVNGAYEGSIVFGSDNSWHSGIRQHDDGHAEMRIWHKNSNGRIYIATGYDGEPTSISKPNDGLLVRGNRLGIGNFSAVLPDRKLHVKTTDDVQIKVDGDTSSWAGIEWRDTNGSNYEWFNGSTSTWSFGGGGSSSNTEKRIHAHGGVSIGAGLQNTTVPTNGLSVEGDVNFFGHASANSINAGGVYNYDASAHLRVTHPGGAAYNTTSSTTTGAIKIVLPVSWTNTMMRMTIKVYEYTMGESFTIDCGGYNYSSSSQWINTFAYITGQGGIDRNFTVRFGHDGTKCCIYIGELNSAWTFPQVSVTDFQGAFQGTSGSTWRSGWDIAFESSAFGTVTKTHTETDNQRYHRDIYVGGQAVVDANRNLTNITGLDMTASTTADIDLNRSAFITFYGSSDRKHGIGSRDNAGAASDDIRINTFGNLFVNLDSNNNNSSNADFVIGRHGSDTGGMDLLLSVSGEDGDLITEGNVTAYGSPSDIRLKENIETIANAVEKVQNLDGVTFNYKKDGGRSTGLIAQQLQEVLPEVVYTAKDLEGEEHLAVRYGNVVGLLVEAIKEQQTQLTAQQEQINQLTNLVNTLMEK